MFGIPTMIKNMARKVTLELVYQAIDERTHELKERIDVVDNGVIGLRGEIKDLRQTMDQHYSQINGRIDQLYHLYAEFLRVQRRGR